MSEKLLKTAVIDFVESQGNKASWSEIHDFIIKTKIDEGKIDANEYASNPKKFRGRYTSCLCDVGPYMPEGYMRHSSKKEPRYLERITEGMYEVRYDFKKEPKPYVLYPNQN